MAWIAIMPVVPGEAQVKAEAETTGEQCPSHLVVQEDWWEFEALEHDASELA